MPRSDKLWFDELEPPIITSDTVVIENYLAQDKKSGRIAASFREPHLKDIDSFKKRLAQEPAHGQEFERLCARGVIAGDTRILRAAPAGREGKTPGRVPLHEFVD